MDSLMDDCSPYSRVSPFRDLRIKGYLLLPEAYRSLSRLSSAPSAKAFALRPCSLDHSNYSLSRMACILLILSCQRRLLLPFLLKLQYFLKELTIIFVSQLLFSFQGTSLSVLFRALKIEQYLLCLYLSPVPDGRPSSMFFHLPDSLERR